MPKIWQWQGEVTSKKAKSEEAMVDNGAYMLAINEDIKIQLGLSEVDKKLATLADGTTIHLSVVGPVEIRFSNRKTNVMAMVLPGNADVLLGAIPMEDMDVIMDPLMQQLIVHPERPYIPKLSLKQLVSVTKNPHPH